MDTGTLCRLCRGGSLVLMKITRAQAGSLARLIRIQLDAYAEAVGGVPARRRARLFTPADLARVEPLLEWLEP